MNFSNVLSPEDFNQLRDSMKENPDRRPIDKNKRKRQQNDASGSFVMSGEFIAVPLNMLELKSSGLSHGDVLVMAFIHRYQRMDPEGFCRLNAKGIALTLGLSPSNLSNHFKKLNSLRLLVQEKRGAEKVFRVDEEQWAQLCDFKAANIESLRLWTTNGVFCRIPLWAASDRRLTDADKILFGRIVSFYARKSHDAFRQSIQTVMSELHTSRSAVKSSLTRLVMLGLLTKFDNGPRIPAEYIVNETGCERFASEGSDS